MRFFAPFVLVVAGCTAAPVGESQQRIVGGTSDTGDPNVVLLINGDLNGNSTYLCTGEIVSPHVVLTAGHCTNSAPPYHIYLGSNLDTATSPSKFLTATAHPHPQYKGDDHDIGVAILDQPVTIAPLPFAKDDRVTGMIGEMARLVGYGVTSGTDTNGVTAGQKRQVMSPLSGLDSQILDAVDFLDTTHNSCEGDSGGPALMKFDGVETIISVVSVGFASSRGDNCMHGGADTRVDLYADWVQSFIDQYDPAPPDMTTLPPSQNGFPVSTTGANCKDNADCQSQICVNAPNGYCTASCDPYQAVDQCPSGLHCAPASKNPADGYFCQLSNHRASGGCSTEPGSAPMGVAFGVLLALALLFVARRARA